MGDRVLVLDGGLVRQLGTPREVYDQPADTFVATFLGSPPMNLLENGEVVFGFRPEALRPAAEANAPSVRLRLRIRTVEYLGAERVAYGVLEGGRFGGRKVVSRLPASSAWIGSPDEVQDFAVARDQIRLFDKASTRRLENADRERIDWPST